ncbi:MAG TPA: LOG family protein [Bacteroidota bacterium]|nr:LOG family protein [Bacteroidota bacterium]
MAPKALTGTSTVTIFGSSRLRPEDPEYRIAHDLGALLAQNGYTICNGGYGGSMEATARGAKEHGGRTIGIITGMFSTTANPFIDTIVVTQTHAERLMKLVETGDAYVVLKGSTGTLLELAMVWEYLNKGILKNKPIIVLGEFWKPVIDTLKGELAWEGAGDAAAHVTIAHSPEECVKALNRRMHHS